ncbi:hypothetical protein CHRY9390_01628 [Chryseobacterium aquaeductus]|uniref:Lipoprotein n=1 Tax=Chryseobacterium aquaeductus TaxID=2675056 RepID=A0A9N8MFQ1_9FLAO|nr:hypothetical protein [Chryseobacterium aquaeductus]CAA7330949.1 hypothetical protein CHRY9390_01628 [Chryseobacterium potabilaquae]CAD7807221.1 hypothetical protein CHRY9390_01628 [Chryseobacterium aquaeductus]
MKMYILILISFLFIGCSFDKTYENRESDKEDAKKVTDRFYFLMQENNHHETFKLFSIRFFDEVGKEKFKQILDDTNIEFGKVKNYELINSWTQIIEGSNPISKYELSYLVTRDSIQTKEHFKMQKENDTIKIIAYRLDFDVVPKK